MRRVLLYTILVGFGIACLACTNKQPNAAIVKDSQPTTDSSQLQSVANEYDPAEDPEAFIEPAKEPIKPEDLPVRKVGELVLEDSLDIYENEVLSFMLLDSLLSDKQSSRNFYFKVFNKMMDRSGGIYGEAVGDYALTYVETYPKEFLSNTKNFSPTRMESWASNIGIELYLSEGDKREAYNRSSKSIEANCKNCDTAEKARLDSFSRMIWTTIEQNLQERQP